ncbi:MAG: ATP-dependent DNA helicase RecG [Crocinitomicaceae bacterium]|nr:ATP-dependent DNA helicase RecG [Crocinitomicaceae bacterium]MBK8926746.1 ATP-dependent DNA helicase RecG [Crocinitomicaceae bacterium]
MNDLLSTPIEYLKGVGPQRGAVLRKEAQIFTFGDLLNYFPFRYVDKTKFQKISDIGLVEGYVQLKGRITHIKEVTTGRLKRLEARFDDGSGSLDLVWFKGGKWIKPKLISLPELIVYGKPKQYGARINIAHPEMEILTNQSPPPSGLQAVYHSGEKLQSLGFTSKGFEHIMAQLLPQIQNQIEEFLPQQLVGELGLLSREQAYLQIHAPSNFELAKRAQFRMKFEELFLLQLELLIRKQITQKKIKGIRMQKVGDVFNDFFHKHLPYQLTGAQKKVIREIREDMASGIHMNRLLQGDVGSGKTLVALMVMLIAVDNGHQACIMAPTEILATQHYNTLCEFVKDMHVNIELLTGSTKQGQRKSIHARLKSGEINILVGTHALLEKVVEYKDLGVAIIDEQHRFGVAQRSKLWTKNTLPPHVLVMTATPIPRTLALTFYGDLDISVIDEMPPGRKPVHTSHRFESARLKVFKFMEEEIAKGRQIYVVYPLIQESEKMDYQNLMDGYDSIVRRFPLPNYRVSIVHGQLKPEVKDYEMQQFVKGITNIMVATTVIEVGVNVPNASVMIIESAEKFGLSQLHQLRGRVGRGADQSYCILMTGYKLGADAKARLETMCETNDGFKIAETDLRLRGPGDIMGTQQSGLLNLKLSDLSRDAQIVSLAREKARQLLDEDPTFEKIEHRFIVRELKKILKEKPNWSRIS